MASHSARTADAKLTPSSAALARAALAESIRVKRALLETCVPVMAEAGDRLAAAFRAGNKALLFGNGGSAADAQHIAAEWVGRFGVDRPALPALALAANSSDLTSIANDYGFEHVFVREVEAHGQPGDVAVGFSTSGTSANVIEALRVAQARGLFTIALAGDDETRLAEVCDLVIAVPSHDTPRVQESHIAIGHVLCEIVEATLFGAARSA